MTNAPVSNSSPGPAIRYGLIVSVALNLFLAGLWIGTVGLHLFHGPGPEGEAFSARIARLVDAADKEKIAPYLADLDVAAHRGWEGVGQAREKVVAAISAQTFDAAAFIAALTTLRESDNAMRQSLDEHLSLILARLPQASRAAIAREIFSRRPPPPQPPSSQ